MGLLATRVATALDALRATGTRETQSVVLLGDPGVGKTSLLNLLVRVGERAATSNPGAAPAMGGPPRAPGDAELEAVGRLEAEFALREAAHRPAEPKAACRC